MTIFIFNHRISNEQMIVEAQSIAEDQPIIWQGTPKQFKDTGFDESQIGGFELVDNKLVFSQNKWNEAQKQKLPIATGKGLKAYLNEIESNMTDAQVEQLFVKMGSFYDLLDQSRFNPMTEAKKDSLIAVMNTKFTNGTAQILTDYINAWKETVRFAT